MSFNDFDAEATHGEENGLFGIPTQIENSELVLIPVPWDATASYGGGACDGPGHILTASPQLDLFDFEFGDSWKKGFHMLPIPEDILKKSQNLRPRAQEVMKLGATEAAEQLSEVNKASEELNKWVYESSLKYLNQGKKVAVIGGDHSSPLGCIRAHLEKYDGKLGILHIDAHADLRVAYQGFSHSHASIMDNVLSLPTPPEKLVQVGIRDFCQSEYDYIIESSKITTFFDSHIKAEMLSGSPWSAICERILSELPDNVYMSVDIDGLDPALCPDTGTPVPGGLQYEELTFLMTALRKAGKRLIGFDLCEVAPSADPENEWNGNVGARVLYQLCGNCVQ